MKKTVREKYDSRIEALIRDGMTLASSIKHNSSQSAYGHDWYQWDEQNVHKWTSDCCILFESLRIRDGKLKERMDAFETVPVPSKDFIQRCIGFLVSLRENLKLEFLDEISTQIEADISADYMGQAESLLSEGQLGRYDHVPAAVLAGAVLEKGLRTLCTRQTPEISTAKEKGEQKMMGLLIDDLKRAGAFNELKAKQLRAWADIRNAAAHGEFDRFSRKDVETMIPSINHFLADYLN